MNGKLTSRESRRTSMARRNVGVSWGRLALFSLGMVMVLLAGLALPGAKVLADEPCRVCAEASDPVQATHLALHDVGAAGLMTGDASDPLQYTFAARLAVSEARAAEISRLRALAGPGAGSWPAYDELVHLRGLLEAAASSSMVSSSESDSEIARLWGLAGPGAASGVRNYELARLRGLAGPGAGSWPAYDELVHLRGLLEAAASSSMVSSSESNSEIARLWGLAGPGATSLSAADLAREAEIARLRGLSGPGAAYGTVELECGVC